MSYNVIRKLRNGGIMKRMTMAKWRIEMYKWVKKAKPGDEIILTHAGNDVLTIKKGVE